MLNGCGWWKMMLRLSITLLQELRVVTVDRVHSHQTNIKIHRAVWKSCDFFTEMKYSWRWKAPISHPSALVNRPPLHGAWCSADLCLHPACKPEVFRPWSNGREEGEGGRQGRCQPDSRWTDPPAALQSGRPIAVCLHHWQTQQHRVKDYLCRFWVSDTSLADLFIATFLWMTV